MSWTGGSSGSRGRFTRRSVNLTSHANKPDRVWESLFQEMVVTAHFRDSVVGNCDTSLLPEGQFEYNRVQLCVGESAQSGEQPNPPQPVHHKWVIPLKLIECPPFWNPLEATYCCCCRVKAPEGKLKISTGLTVFISMLATVLLMVFIHRWKAGESSRLRIHLFYSSAFYLTLIVMSFIFSCRNVVLPKR